MQIAKIMYSRVKGKTRYWEPSVKLRALDFIPLKWTEGPAARETARKETARALAAIESPKKTKPTVVPGSLAHWYSKFIERKNSAVKFGEIKPRTAEEYVTAWKHISPALGKVLLRDLTPGHVTNFFRHLSETKTPKVRHRCIAKLKTILQEAVTWGLIPVNPAAGQTNPAPKPRRAFYTPDEMTKLIKGALDIKMVSMSLCIRLMYETARAPVDARSITLSAICQDATGPFIDRSREKTGVEGFQGITQALYDDIMRYVASLNVELLPDAPIFRRHVPQRRRRTVDIWNNESDFSKDFRVVRDHVFGKDETRKAMDIRRTANLEASLGGAKPEERAALLANTLDKDASLDNVYTPPTLAAARKANAARFKGQQILLGQKIENGTF